MGTNYTSRANNRPFKVIPFNVVKCPIKGKQMNLTIENVELWIAGSWCNCRSWCFGATRSGSPSRKAESRLTRLWTQLKRGCDKADDVKRQVEEALKKPKK